MTAPLHSVPDLDDSEQLSECDLTPARLGGISLAREVVMADFAEHHHLNRIPGRHVALVLMALAAQGLLREERLRPGMTVDQVRSHTRLQRRLAQQATATRMW